MKKACIAYCHENEALASELAAGLSRHGYQFTFDTFDFERHEEILKSLLADKKQPLILLVSGNLLKSIDAMRNFTEYVKSVSEQAMVVVAPEVVKKEDGSVGFKPTEFTTINEVMHFRDYWYEKWIDLRKQKGTADADALPELEERVNIAQKASTTTGSFLRILRELLPVKIDEFKADNFAAFINRFENENPPQSVATPVVETPKSVVEDVVIEIPAETPVVETAKPKTKAEQPEATKPKLKQQAANSDSTEVRLKTKKTAEIKEKEVSTPVTDEVVSPSNEDELLGVPDGEDEGVSPLSETYVETVNKEMEKAAKIIKELENEEETPKKKAPKTSITIPRIESKVIDDDDDIDLKLDDDDDDELKIDEDDDATVPVLFTPEHPTKKADKLFGSYLAHRPESLSEQEAKLKEIVTLDNLHDKAWLELAVVAEKQGNYEAAADAYQKVIALRPGDANVYFKLALLLDTHFENKKDEASTYYKNALYLDETQAECHYKYAVLLEDYYKKDKRAAKHFKLATEHDPNHADAYLRLAYLLRNSFEKADAARKCYVRATTLNETLKNDERDADFPEPKPSASPQFLAFQEAQAAEFEANSKRIVLITGATSGIGKATATAFAKRGFKLIVIGRREEMLDALQEELESTYHIQVASIVIDVRDKESVFEAYNALPEDWKSIDILINNAGLAKGLSPIHEGEFDHWEQMIDTNIKGLLYVTRAVVPQMVARRKGHIINIASTAGKETYPKGNVYSATKAAVDSLSKGMRMDLYSHNVRVTNIAPGHVEETEFALVRFDGDAEKAKIYEDFQPLKSSDVAEVIYFAATRPDHVCLNDIVLTGTQQAGSQLIDRSGR